MQHTLAPKDAPPIVGVIDPDPVARSGLRTLLHGLGIDVSTFDSAENFLLATNGRAVACLIVDLLLPGMSGLELLRRLRSAGNDVPVILLADESDVPTAVAASTCSTPSSSSVRAQSRVSDTDGAFFSSSWRIDRTMRATWSARLSVTPGTLASTISRSRSRSG